jgi:hypothetical protein
MHKKLFKKNDAQKKRIHHDIKKGAVEKSSCAIKSQKNNRNITMTTKRIMI